MSTSRGRSSFESYDRGARRMVKRSQDRAQAREQAQNLEQIHAHMKALEGENRALINRNDSIKQELIEAQARTPAQAQVQDQALALVPPQSHLPQARTPAQAQVQDQARTPAPAPAPAEPAVPAERAPAAGPSASQPTDFKITTKKYNCDVNCSRIDKEPMFNEARMAAEEARAAEEAKLQAMQRGNNAREQAHKEQQARVARAMAAAGARVAAREAAAREAATLSLSSGGSTYKRKKGGKKSKKYKRKTNKKKVLKKRKVTKKKRTRRR